MRRFELTFSNFSHGESRVRICTLKHEQLTTFYAIQATPTVARNSG
jgi:hypothetical protein